MKQSEVLKMAESVLKVLVANDVDMNDVKHLEMYEDLKRLKSEGHKKMYIYSYLEEQYGVPMTTIYRVEKRMEREIVFR